MFLPARWPTAVRWPLYAVAMVLVGAAAGRVRPWLFWVIGAPGAAAFLVGALAKALPARERVERRDPSPGRGPDTTDEMPLPILDPPADGDFEIRVGDRIVQQRNTGEGGQ